MTVALIDGDIIAYQAAAGACSSIDWGDGAISDTVDVEGAKEAALSLVDEWREGARCRRALVAFSGAHNFRKVLYPPYKANRVKPKPGAYWDVVGAIKDRFDHRAVDGLEADDVLGILLTSPRYQNAVCVSIDKDLRSVPGRHFNPHKDTVPAEVDGLQAQHWWLMQTLHGDHTDNYPGIPGVGPKRASKLLEGGGGWGAVVSAYVAAGLTEDDAITQARVARILRRADYDKTTKEVILWHPTKPERLSLATLCASSSPPSHPG